MADQTIPDYETISAAVTGETWAVEKVLMCYKDEIDRQATVKKRQPDGTFKLEIDEDMRQYITMKLIEALPQFPLEEMEREEKRNRDKNHKKVDGKLLRTDKQFRHLKQRQKETISTWLYEEYRRLWIEKGQEPHKYNNREIVAAVMERIEAAGIWLPEQEVTKYFYRRKTHYRNRIEKELQPKPEMQDKDSQTQKEQGAGSQ